MLKTKDLRHYHRKRSSQKPITQHTENSSLQFVNYLNVVAIN